MRLNFRSDFQIHRRNRDWFAGWGSGPRVGVLCLGTGAEEEEHGKEGERRGGLGVRGGRDRRRGWEADGVSGR